ncbi:Dabb family protein [Aestuariicella hydrocarbonica]|uniref:Dabb family protein n=2 Tax=Pseudomaricurvus hydrocarbonicus TaxID=1470433 RepID=A0A9E5MLW0_9GAMM|nr:Dabb family protein [Aestuariicella hydrocarbonica]
MILHTVAFKTKHKTGSREEREFLEAGMALANLPMVKNFECYKQTGRKNPFEFGFSMVFDSDQDYDAYNRHPEHVAFVENRWNTEVEDFIELDYTRHEISEI